MGVLEGVGTGGSGQGGAVRVWWTVVALCVVAGGLAWGSSVAAQAVVPERPTGLAVTAVAHNAVTLEWDDPGDASISGYRILRRDIVRQSPGVFSVVAPDTASAATAFTDGTVEPETRYAYRIVALNAAGESRRSGYVNATTAAAPDPVPEEDQEDQAAGSEEAGESEEAGADSEAGDDVAPVYADPPTGVSASYADGAVTIAWDDPGAESGVTRHGVWRAEHLDGDPELNFDMVSEELPGTATSWVDTTVEGGLTYEYAVLAWPSLPGPGDPSEDVTWSNPSASVTVVIPDSGPPLDPPEGLEPAQWPVGTVVLGDLTSGDAQSTQQIANDAEPGSVLFGFSLTDVRAVAIGVTPGAGVTVGYALERDDGTAIGGRDIEATAISEQHVLSKGHYVVTVETGAGEEGEVELSVGVSAVVTEDMIGGDAPDGQASRARMVVNSTWTGTRASLDDRADTIGVWLEAGERYSLQIDGDYGNSAFFTKVESEQGRRYGRNHCCLSSVWRVREAGLHFITVEPLGNVGGDYKFYLHHAVDDFAADTGTQGRIEVGGSVIGRLDHYTGEWWNYETDWIAAELTGGRLYQMTVAPHEMPGDSLPPADELFFMFPRNSQGEVAAPIFSQSWPVADDFGASMYFGPTESDTYYLVVDADLLGRLGHYRVTLEDVTPEFDPPPDSSTTARLVPDGPIVEGFLITPEDVDWYRVTLEAGVSYRFSSTTRWDDDLAVEMAGIRYLNPGGTRVSAVKPGTLYSTSSLGIADVATTVFTPTRSGDYFVQYQGNNGGLQPYRSGPYRVQVDVADSMDESRFAEVQEAAVRMEVDSQTGQTAEADGVTQHPPGDDEAWFVMSMDAEMQYTTEFSHYQFFRRAVYDSDGNVVAGSNDSSSNRNPFRPPADGDYYIRVGYYKSRNWNSYYRGMQRNFDGSESTNYSQYGAPERRTPPDREPFSVTVVEAEPPPPPPPPQPRTPEEAMFAKQPDAVTTVLSVGVPQEVGGADPGDDVGGDTQSGDDSQGRSVPDDPGLKKPGSAAAPSSASSRSELSASSSSGDSSSGDSSSGDSSSASSDEPVEVLTAGEGGLDWFMVSLAAGGPYWVEIHGGEFFGDREGGPLLAAVFASDGDVLYTRRNHSDHSHEELRRFRLEPETDAAFYVAVRSNGEGYAITVVDASVDPETSDVPGDAAAENLPILVVGLGGRVMGEIGAAGDVDCYQVSLGQRRAVPVRHGGHLGRPLLLRGALGRDRHPQQPRNPRHIRARRQAHRGRGGRRQRQRGLPAQFAAHVHPRSRRPPHDLRTRLGLGRYRQLPARSARLGRHRRAVGRGAVEHHLHRGKLHRRRAELRGVQPFRRGRRNRREHPGARPESLSARLRPAAHRRRADHAASRAQQLDCFARRRCGVHHRRHAVCGRRSRRHPRRPFRL